MNNRYKGILPCYWWGQLVSLPPLALSTWGKTQYDSTKVSLMYWSGIKDIYTSANVHYRQRNSDTSIPPPSTHPPTLQKNEKKIAKQNPEQRRPTERRASQGNYWRHKVVQAPATFKQHCHMHECFYWISPSVKTFIKPQQSLGLLSQKSTIIKFATICLASQQRLCAPQGLMGGACGNTHFWHCRMRHSVLMCEVSAQGWVLLWPSHPR